MSREFRTYGVDELNELVQSITPTRVSLILDETAVDFLLSLRQNERSVNDDHVARLAESIEDEVLQTIGTLSVSDERLVDGLTRLLAVKELGYPESLCATVVFGDKLE